MEATNITRNVESLRKTFLKLRAELIKGSKSTWEIDEKYKCFLFECDDEGRPIKIKNPNAFFLGALVDRQIPSEKAWAFPYELERRLGSIDPYFLADLPTEKIEEAIARKPALHRMPHIVAKSVKRAAVLLVKKYDGDASLIWNTAESYKDLYERLKQFYGIGDKIARMTIRILNDYFGYNFAGVDLPVDTHVERVVGRLTGDRLAPEEFARMLFPESLPPSMRCCFSLVRTIVGRGNQDAVSVR